MLFYEEYVGKLTFQHQRDVHLTVAKTPKSIFLFVLDFLPYEIYVLQQMQDKYLRTGFNSVAQTPVFSESGSINSRDHAGYYPITGQISNDKIANLRNFSFVITLMNNSYRRNQNMCLNM